MEGETERRGFSSTQGLRGMSNLGLSGNPGVHIYMHIYIYIYNVSIFVCSYYI